MFSMGFRKRIVEEELSLAFRKLHRSKIEQGLIPDESDFPLKKWAGFLQIFGGLVIGGFISIISIWGVYSFILLFFK